MISLNKLKLPNTVEKKIEDSIQDYQRLASVYISILAYENNKLTVRIEQRELVNEKLLTQKDLIEKAKAVFAEIPENVQLNIRPLTYKGGLTDDFDIKQVREELKQRKIKNVDLVRYLNIDKHQVSRIVNGDGLTKSQKAMFYYFFKWMDASF